MEKFVSTYNFTLKQKIYILIIKRFFDFFIAFILFLLVLPISLLIVIVLKIESNDKVLFIQKRPGYHQEIFNIYKFRSMKSKMVENGRMLTDDERLTRFGNFLRKTSLDEIPQLVNIMKGQMSFIGPRPFLINDLGTYSRDQLIRFEVLPGITSWTAIHGRNMLSIQDKYNYEIYYVKNIGFLIDIKILIKTVLLVLSQKNVVDTVNEGRIGAMIIDDIQSEKSERT